MLQNIEYPHNFFTHWANKKAYFARRKPNPNLEL